MELSLLLTPPSFPTSGCLRPDTTGAPSPHETTAQAGGSGRGKLRQPEAGKHGAGGLARSLKMPGLT